MLATDVFTITKEAVEIKDEAPAKVGDDIPF